MPVKLGIFLCDCGGSLKNINSPKIREDLGKLEDVAFVDISHNLCLSVKLLRPFAIHLQILTEHVDFAP